MTQKEVIEQMSDEELVIIYDSIMNYLTRHSEKGYVLGNVLLDFIDEQEKRGIMC